MNRIVRCLLLACAWISCALGFVGIVIPVLPTTPFLLLAAFLFAKSSPRCHAWIVSTKVYKNYVEAFKESGGMPVSQKVKVLAISLPIMGVSAFVAQKVTVWVILGCAATFLLYLVLIRIPTLPADQASARRMAAQEAQSE
ncbi:DUF454 domain-containing protein [Rubneribacter badeniensis]|uniref:DUF454 domain-containing protein n=1 Tax=Rubneribacter badeniensis TaxID=2070688 RepID=A0A2K2U4M2_9ACTN|nr:YbaN family protein [Rubneribacter badeniensis]PNV65158.1 DUF454 domain-containing protein [Rubneribacter badeniensis]CVH77549.1 Inner membrane protein YbaN [Coriobacteriaceae bacterium CHKCI002]HJH43906.1 YbaN family protein [Rubneribacter badeniensis]